MSDPEGAGGGSIVSFFKDKSWMFLLRLAGGASACVLIVVGCLGAATLGSLNPTTLVNDIYQILFGALIICAELRWIRFLKQFSFLTSFLGLGMFYIFVGGLALDTSWWMLVIAIIFFALGFVYIGLYFVRKYQQRKNPATAGAAPGTAASTDHTDLSGPDHVEEAAKAAVAKQAMKHMFGSSKPKPTKAQSFNEFVDEDEAANRA